MSLPQDLEGVAQEKLRAWEKEIKQRQLLQQLPQKPPRWHSWTGSMLLWLGSQLTHFGERLTRRERQEQVQVPVKVLAQ